MLRGQGVPLDIVVLRSFYKLLGRKTAKQHQPVLQVCTSAPFAAPVEATVARCADPATRRRGALSEQHMLRHLRSIDNAGQQEIYLFIGACINCGELAIAKEVRLRRGFESHSILRRCRQRCGSPAARVCVTRPTCVVLRPSPTPTCGPGSPWLRRSRSSTWQRACTTEARLAGEGCSTRAGTRRRLTTTTSAPSWYVCLAWRHIALPACPVPCPPGLAHRRTT